MPKDLDVEVSSSNTNEPPLATSVLKCVEAVVPCPRWIDTVRLAILKHVCFPAILLGNVVAVVVEGGFGNEAGVEHVLEPRLSAQEELA